MKRDVAYCAESYGIRQIEIAYTKNDQAREYGGPGVIALIY
jgi:hypothetical protein